MKRERALLAQSLFLPATLRLRPALIGAACVLPSTPRCYTGLSGILWLANWRVPIPRFG
jgi:hypothetical protein